MLYKFFDYKYNIEGYAGGDFDKYRLVYLIVSMIVISVIAVAFHKTKKEKIDIYLKVVAILVTVFEIAKVTWESIYDVKTSIGY